MTAILQISDTHIVRQGALVSGRLETSDTLARLVARLGDIRDQIGPIDALLISGDLSDDGTAESYARLKALIAPLGLPVCVIPGNHDARAPMRAAFAERVPEKGPLNWRHRFGDLHLIGLDTLVEGQSAGRLEAESLSFLHATLSEAGDAPVLLALHHPPFLCGVGFMDDIGLTNREALTAILTDHRGPLRLVCGHIHSLMISDVAGHIAISAPALASTIAPDCRPDAPVGFMTQEDGCLLHRWDGGFQSIRIGPTSGAGPYPF